MKTINFAIDLGTTNSLIARAEFGQTNIYKNPIGHKETLPSVVAFRGDRIIIGDKAREYMEKDPENVVSNFKRKMGTSESFFIQSLEDTRTPIQLSSLVLKELKNFVHDLDNLESTVITIPASFDTVQSNATKKAGYEAGFKEVVLLQEPIAACLAFANKGQEEKQGKWLVYDLGGGTFDVAIVNISESELDVLDHKGDNFLGGVDFDNILIDKIILKRLFAMEGFGYLEEERANQSLEFRKLYTVLLHKAEMLKKELSAAEQAEIEFYAVNQEGTEQEIYFTVTRDEFNLEITPKLQYTIDLINDLLESNELKSEEIEQVIMVGGSTYIPKVKEMIESQLKISVNNSVDPTSAVVSGACQYAATKKSNIISIPTENQIPKPSENGVIEYNIKTSYLKSSKDNEELFMAVIEGEKKGLHYRITREDGGFDSGIKPVNDKVMEYLALAPGVPNRFFMKLLDEDQNPLSVEIEPIEILQGKYNVSGQPLPEDICIEIDDIENNTTKLEVIFEKNSILPLKKTIYREISKTIFKGSEEKLIINILEGSRHASPETNQVIGLVEIEAEKLEFDLVRGSDVEIKLEISESRDLNISIFLSLSEQEFKDAFNPSEKYVSLSKLREETNILIHKIKSDMKEYESDEEFELAGNLSGFLNEAELIKQELSEISSNSADDGKYHLEERKRRLAQKFDQTGKGKKLTKLRQRYFEIKGQLEVRVNMDETNSYKAKFDSITANEKDFIGSNSLNLVKEKTDKLQELSNEMFFSSKQGIIFIHHRLSSMDESEFTDPKQARIHLEKGEKALERKNYDELSVLNNLVLQLLTSKQETFMKQIKGTGIG